MNSPALQIVQPVDGSAFPAGTPVALRARLTGDTAGLYVKWYSSLNSAATAEHPELNVADHSLAMLDWSAALPEFGSLEDFPLKQALNQLKGKPVVASKTMVERRAALDAAPAK